MDLNTPSTDGREALAAIEGDDARKLYPVMVFSANACHVKPVRYPNHLQLVIDLLTYWLERVVLPHSAGTRS